MNANRLSGTLTPGFPVCVVLQASIHEQLSRDHLQFDQRHLSYPIGFSKAGTNYSNLEIVTRR
jgi:hypothetical protein